LRMRI
jgi:hypothetical protein